LTQSENNKEQSRNQWTRSRNNRKSIKTKAG
jgi:hypothetical protein